jgi:hypothetical protein
MVSSGMLLRVALVITDVSEELSASFIRVTRIGKLGTTLAVTSNRRTLRTIFELDTSQMQIRNIYRLKTNFPVRGTQKNKLSFVKNIFLKRVKTYILDVQYFKKKIA